MPVDEPSKIGRYAASHVSADSIDLVKVGAYVDAYNLYYGMREHCGRGTQGWRWLDVRRFIEDMVSWPNAEVFHVVYCTARVLQSDDPDAYNDQDVYIKALKAHGAIDELVLGRYVARTKSAPLAVQGPKNRRGTSRPEVVTPQGDEEWPSHFPIVKVQDKRGEAFLATVLNREEKGSDVNVATNLLVDVLKGDIDAAVVVSNDSDLALPIKIARSKVPVLVINPGRARTAGSLRCDPTEGAGSHGWTNVSAERCRSLQMPDLVAGRWSKPVGW